MSSVVVVIPTYNERENIEAVVRGVVEAVPSCTVLVVDDNSPDGTAECCEALSNVIPNIQLIRRAEKTGLGAAYRAGFQYALDAGATTIIQMDADLSHDPKVLPSLLAAISEGADIAIGSRYVPGGSTPDWPVRRRLLSKYGNSYARFMLKITAHDTTAGFRAYRAECLRAIDVATTETNGYGFQIETLYLLNRQHFRIMEVPITFRDRVAGDSKMHVGIMMETMSLVTRWGVRIRLGKSVAQRSAKQ